MTTRKKIIVSLLSLVIVLCIGICVPSVFIARAAECTDHDFSSYYNWDDENHWHACNNCSAKTDQAPHAKVVQYDDQIHWTVCSECHAWFEEHSHTFASSAAVKCDGCDFSRAVIDYSGYEIDGLISDFKITIPEDVEAIAFGEGDYFEICIIDETIGLNELCGTYPNEVFLPNREYHVSLFVRLNEDYSQDEVLDNLSIAGLGGALAVDRDSMSPQSLTSTNFNKYVAIEFILPKLGGVSTVKTISSLNYTISGCEIGSPVNQLQVTIDGDAAYDLDDYMVVTDSYVVFPETQTDKVFDSSLKTMVVLFFTPHDGYIFEGITEESVNTKGLDERCNIQINYGGYVLSIEYALSSFMEPHICDFDTADDFNYHWDECSICGAIAYKEEHEYQVGWIGCNICGGGNYNYKAEMQPIVFEFSGYKLGGTPSDIQIEVNSNAYLLSEIYTYFNNFALSPVENVNYYIDSDVPLALYTDYYLSVWCEITLSSEFGRDLTVENFQLKGVGAATAFSLFDSPNGSYVEIYFRLPQLTDESLVSSLDELNFTVENFAVGDNHANVLLNGNGMRFIDYGFAVAYAGTSTSASASEVITQGNPYELFLEFSTTTDYPIDLLEDFTKDKLTVNGADELLSFNKYYDATLGCYVIEAYYSLVLDYEHEHNYQIINYSDVAHWQLCECGAAFNIAEHNIILNRNDENFGKCSYCGFEDSLEIKSIEYSLYGYKVGGRMLYLYSDPPSILTPALGGDFQITDSSTALLGDYESYMYGAIQADKAYYLSIIVDAVWPFSISSRLTAKDITLKGYGTAKVYYYNEDVSEYIAVFELPKLELVPHIHGGLFVDEEISICDTDTKIKGYYQCTICDKYFDKQNNEIDLKHKFANKWDDDKHWVQCEVCGFKHSEGSHKISNFSDALTHSQTCSVCGFNNKSDHVYESATDNTCDECGFKRLLIDYSGYVVDGRIADFVLTVSENDFGVSLDEDEGWAIFVGEQSDYVSDDERLTSYFRPNETYTLWLELIVPHNCNLSQLLSGGFTVAGVGGFVVQWNYSVTSIEIYLGLPILGGVSTIKTVENLDVIVDGLKVGNLVNNINVELAKNSEAILDEFFVYVGGHSYSVDEQTDTLFESGTVAYIELYFIPTKGYTFYGFTKEKITISGLSDFDINVFQSGGAIVISGTVDFRNDECEHDVVWDTNPVTHQGMCSICLETFYDDHVDNDDDLLCDVCGRDVSSGFYINSIEATLQGYELDNEIIDVTVSLAKGTQGIDWENAEYGSQWFIATDVALTYVLDETNGYFAPDQTYYLAINYKTLNNYTFGHLYDLAIEGVGEPLYIYQEASSETVLVVYKLPTLKGTSTIKPVGDITVDVSGYVYNGTVQDTSIELREQYQSISKMTSSFMFWAEKSMQDTDVFDNNNPYYIVFDIVPAKGYDFRNFTEKNFTLNGVTGTLIDFYFASNNSAVSLVFLLDAVEQEHTCDSYTLNADFEYHQQVCSICRKPQSEQEAHKYFEEYCSICGMPRYIVINSITFTLEGYELGKEADNLKLTTNCRDIILNPVYGVHYKIFNTPFRADYGDCDPLYQDLFLYVMLIPRDQNVTFPYLFSEKDVVIEGLGSAEYIDWGGYVPIAMFRLPKFEYPHNHGGAWIDEVPATCSSTGTKGYYECTVCGKYFDKQNAEIEDLTIAVDQTKHNFGDWIDEVPATCSSTGTKGYYKCADCGKYFDKQNAEIEDLTIAVDQTNHNFGAWIDEVPATCSSTGTKGYYECTVCGKYFDKQNAEIEDLTIAVDQTNHNFGAWIDEVPATCTTTGTKGYYKCADCGKYFDKQNAEIEDLTIAVDQTNHNFGAWIDEVPATCSSTGTKGYYECTVCGKYFDKQNAEIEDLTIAVDQTNHNFGAWIDEVPATTQDQGVKGHKDCLICNKHFDAEGNELLDLTIEKLGGDTPGDSSGDTPGDSSGDTPDDSSGDTPDDSSAGITDSSSGSSSGSSDETESCVSSVYSQSLVAMLVLAILVLVKSKRAKQN